MEQSPTQLSHPLTVPVRALASAGSGPAQTNCDGVGTCIFITDPSTFPRLLTYIYQLHVQQEHATPALMGSLVVVLCSSFPLQVCN